METKPIWESKTIWVALIGFVVLVVQHYKPEFQLPAELQSSIILGAMALLRLITTNKVTMK